MNKDAKIYVAGHRGMVGSALLRQLQARGYHNFVIRSRDELDLQDQSAVNEFFENEKIDMVFLAAAKVGGIHANNTYRADFIYQNLMIQANVIHAAFNNDIERLLFLGSSCIYPQKCVQPMKEEHLLGGYLEPTNEPYAIAKIAGIKLCESYNRQYGTRYRAVMPTNLYGPNDNFDLNNAHVLPAMIRKFHLTRLALNKDYDAIAHDESRFGPIPEDTKQILNQDSPVVKLWGTGVALREFLHVDDMADACLHVMNMSDQQYEEICQAESEFKQQGIDAVSHINVGYGQEISVRQLAEIINEVTDFQGDIIWDNTMPDGMPRKLMDTTRLNQSGWTRKIELIDGIRQTVQWYTHQVNQFSAHP
jgi:GDP-L-fucose synthase